ncbi:MAG: Sec-independent protein translocase protein TatB [Pseudomonadota bacterium]
MFSNFSWSEILVIAVVAIIVVGPKDLPGMLRQFGKTLGTMKRMAGDFQRQFNDAIKDADLDEVKDLATSAKNFGPLDDAKKSMEEFTRSMKEPIETEPELEAESVTKPAETAKAETKPETKTKTAAAKKPAAKKAPAKTTAAKTTAAKAKAPQKAAPKRTVSRKAVPKPSEKAT